jgi:uncharacterized protein YdaL
VLVALSTSACGAVPGARGASVHAGVGPPTLVLYDDIGSSAFLGELYAIATSALVSHFGPWAAAPVATYRKGDIVGYRAVVYLGSTYNQPIPPAFLADAGEGTRPVVWIGDNIWQLVRPGSTVADSLGLAPSTFELGRVAEVVYKGVHLSRAPQNEAGIMRYARLDPHKVTVLATATRPDGSSLPWAVRSGWLTYVGENPLAYTSEKDRYLAFCDLLFDALAPGTPEQHRALVRIEDVHPKTSPSVIRAFADHLSSRGVPFSLAVIPLYQDPFGVFHHGASETVRLEDAPELVDALRYAVARGGSLLMHGYTHQRAAERNPYSGVSAADFEFFRAHVDAANNVVLDGPVAEDSSDWAKARIDEGLRAFDEVGLPRPRIFEYPHYAGSSADSRGIAERFPTVYQRGLYFPGLLSGRPVDYRHNIGVFYPFAVDDVYGWRVVPENLGNYIPVGYNNTAARSPEQIVENARAQAVVRDNVASFFFHPMYDVAILDRIVEGIQQAGYTFVSPESL